MNILLICNKKNLIGNALIIYSTISYNDEVFFFIHCTEDIGDENREYLKKIIPYLNPSCSLFFKDISFNQSLEDQFPYVSNLLYISSDCASIQNFTDAYDTWSNSQVSTWINEPTSLEDHIYALIFFNLKYNKQNNIQSFITVNDMYIDKIEVPKTVQFFEPQIIRSGQFSLNFKVPCIFWFSENNDKIYETNLQFWQNRYIHFQSILNHLELLKTIHF